MRKACSKWCWVACNWLWCDCCFSSVRSHPEGLEALTDETAPQHEDAVDERST